MSRITRALLGLVTVIAVAGVGALGTLGVLRARDDAVARTNSAVRDRARALAQTVHDAITDDMTAVIGTSSSPIVNHAIVFKQYGVVDGYFTELIATHPRIVTASVYDAVGRLVLRLPRDPSIAGRLFRQQEYYSIARATGLPHISSMFVQLGKPKVPVIAYSIRVFHHGGVYGVIVGAVPITSFDSLLAPFTPTGATVSVYDAKGELVSPASLASGRSFTSDPIVGPALKGSSHMLRTNGRVVAAEPVADYGWAIVLSQPAKRADVHLRSLTTRLSMFAGGAFLLAMIAAALAWIRRRPATT